MMCIKEGKFYYKSNFWAKVEHEHDNRTVFSAGVPDQEQSTVDKSKKYT